MKKNDDGSGVGAAMIAPPPAAPISRSKAIVTAFIVASAFLMQSIDSTLLVVAIPSISEHLKATPLALHFAITTYTISLAIFMPVSGWFADRYGARRVFCAALVIFTLGSMLCGLSGNLLQMVGARALQGFGGAIMTPVGRLIVLRAFGKGGTLDAMTYLSLPLVVGPMMGPLLGGFIVTYASWQWIFYVNVPICLVALAVTSIFIARDGPAEPQPFDFSGFFIVGACLLLFQLGVESLGHPFAGTLGTMAFFASAVIVGIAYRRHALRRDNPAFDIDLFSGRPYAVGVIGGGIGRVGLNASAFLLPLLLQIGFGLSPLQAGFYTFLSAFGIFGGKPLIRIALRRFGFRILLIFLVLLGSGLLAAFAAVGPTMPGVILAAHVVVLGAIRSMHFNTVNTLTYSDVPQNLLSRAVSSAGVIQQLSMGMGVSVSAAVLALSMGGNHVLSMHDFSLAFLAMGAIPLLSLPILFGLHPAHGTNLGRKKS